MAPRSVPGPPFHHFPRAFLFYRRMVCQRPPPAAYTVLGPEQVGTHLKRDPDGLYNRAGFAIRQGVFKRRIPPGGGAH